MAILLSNNASSLLDAAILAADTSMTITAGDGALFPGISGSDYFYCTLEDRRVTPNLIEIVKVTALSSNTFTIVRGQDGTTATNFFTGAIVSLRITAAVLFAIRAEETARAEAAEAAEIAARAAAITTEANARIAADAAEAAARAAAITTEQTARIAADATETAARIAADAAEVIARDAAIYTGISGIIPGIGTSIAAAVATETTRAEAAEATLTSGLAAEVSRATAAEAALSARIGSSTTTQGGQGVSDGSGNVTVTFPTPFPTNVDGISLTAWTGSATWAYIVTASPTGFTGKTVSPLAGGSWAVPSCHYFWTAVGH